MSHLVVDNSINLRELACLQRYGYHEVIAAPAVVGGRALWGKACNRCGYSIPNSNNIGHTPVLWNPNNAQGYEYWVWINGEQYPKDDGRTRLTSKTAYELIQKGIHANYRR